jgi:protein-disulfide isomerase
MHETLFANQGMVAQQQFGELAGRSGVEAAGFDDCLAGRKTLPELRKDIADARALGIASTPTIFINGLMIIGAKPYDSLKDLIESELGRAKQASAGVANRSAPPRR